MTFKIIKMTRDENGWVSFTINGCKGMAKFYGEPSVHSIKGTAISKLQIIKKGAADWGPDNTIYNYDRGDDVNRLPKGMFEYLISFFRF